MQKFYIGDASPLLAVVMAAESCQYGYLEAEASEESRWPLGVVPARWRAEPRGDFDMQDSESQLAESQLAVSTSTGELTAAMAQQAGGVVAYEEARQDLKRPLA